MEEQANPAAPDSSASPKQESASSAAIEGSVTIRDVSGGEIHARDIVGRDKITHVYASREQERERRNQLVLLDKVKRFWIEGVLEKSVHHAALMDLEMETQPELVAQHPWETVVEFPDRESQTLPPDTAIAQVFEDAGHALLILGAPGSGKTITLLELARDLIDRAADDPAQPIPVVLNLSTWEEKIGSLAVWVVEELNNKYQIPPKIGRPWLQNDDLLLLLDGFDEVASEQQAACVEAINEFRKGGHGLTGIAVCSRLQEYE